MINTKPIYWWLPYEKVNEMQHLFIMSAPLSFEAEDLVPFRNLLGDDCVFMISLVCTSNQSICLILASVYCCYPLDPLTRVL